MYYNSGICGFSLDSMHHRDANGIPPVAAQPGPGACVTVPNGLPKLVMELGEWNKRKWNILPPSWYEAVDKEGRVYYGNVVTKETTFLRPK